MNENADHDQAYDDYTVTKVEASSEKERCTVTLDSGSCYGLRTSSDAVAVGDALRLYRSPSLSIRGAMLNGTMLYYKTQEEADLEHAQWCADKDLQAEDNYKANQVEYEATISALPGVFQRRIARFREHNPRFNYDYLPYELFTCEEAVKIATALSTPEAVTRWSELKYEEQRAAVPDISDGHSGNTMGCATRLAWLYLSDEEQVTAEHGAMAVLVGCKKYGCHHAGQEGE